MTAVAGDFYEFIPVDQKRVGFLVADVTGHGVPAALIASMIKVAMQSVVPCAHDPREVLRGLNRILFRQLHDQFVSAAYLWLDTENRKGLYSAAGHPPLLRWREGKLERTESNGLLFGVIPDPDYPVCDLPIHSGDRFLLYTDGVIEPENAAAIPLATGSLNKSFATISPARLLSYRINCSPRYAFGNLPRWPSRTTSPLSSSMWFSHRECQDAEGHLSKLVNLRAGQKPISDARTATCVILSHGSGPGGRWFKSIRPDHLLNS